MHKMEKLSQVRNKEDYTMFCHICSPKRAYLNGQKDCPYGHGPLEKVLSPDYNLMQYEVER